MENKESQKFNAMYPNLKNYWFKNENQPIWSYSIGDRFHSYTDQMRLDRDDSISRVSRYVWSYDVTTHDVLEFCAFIIHPKWIECLNHAFKSQLADVKLEMRYIGQWEFKSCFWCKPIECCLRHNSLLFDFFNPNIHNKNLSTSSYIEVEVFI